MKTNNVRLSDFHQSPKPSFPAKRRVRVPQCILYETPTQPGKVSNVKNQSDKFEVVRNVNASIKCKSQKNDSTLLKEKPAFDDKGDPVFKPFFWLRERDDDSDEETSEDLSTQQKDDRSTGNPPFNAPCFSDIKDSADRSPIKMTPTVSLIFLMDSSVCILKAANGCILKSHITTYFTKLMVTHYSICLG